jgi:hypothetical protein
MTTIKISALGNITAITDDTILPVVGLVGPILVTQKTTANAIKNYINSSQDIQISQNINNIAVLQSTVSAQQNSIVVLDSGLTGVSANILVANIGMRGYVDQGNTIQAAAITAANIGMQGYVDNSTITANIGMQGYVDNSTITANIGMKGYVDNSTITANIGMKGYVDNSTITANIGMQGYVDNSTITANIGMQGYVDNINTTLLANAAQQQSQISSIIATSSVGNTAIYVASNITAIVNGGVSGQGNIGSSTATFDTVFAKATTAAYADLAENYAADADYPAGTVVDFGGTAEITLSIQDSSVNVAGVVSTNPAYLMNTDLVGTHIVGVALQGRVPTRVTGKISKGNMLVSAGNGCARAESKPSMGTVIGKALENFDGEDGVIEIVVGVR